MDQMLDTTSIVAKFLDKDKKKEAQEFMSLVHDDFPYAYETYFGLALIEIEEEDWIQAAIYLDTAPKENGGPIDKRLVYWDRYVSIRVRDLKPTIENLPVR